MKQKLTLLALVLAALLCVSPATADTIMTITYDEVGSAIISGIYTGAYDSVASVIPVVAADTASLVVRVTGTAVLNDREHVYLGLSIVADTGKELDTVRIYPRTLSTNSRDVRYVPFTMQWAIQMVAKTDTVYFTAASGTASEVVLEDVVMTCEVLDCD